ncbi:MAG: tetratricopeptide repeat protein, partial [bacterium]|nr:tetratricopeptide repeat protein [bacterium]
MKKLIFLIVFAALIFLPCIGQDDVNYTKEYIDAMQKKGTARINALKAYVKKYPDTGSQFTRLAYYWLALDYFGVKNYGEAVKRGEARLKMGNFGKGEEARLSLVVANSYGITSSPVFNKEKALKFTNKAIALAKKENDKKVLATAQDLKKKLSGPPPKKMSPEQKIKRHYSMEEYSEAISYYKTLGAGDKGNPEIHKTYANSLFKANRLDSAIKEFKTLYTNDKNAAYARRLGEIYVKKARRNKALRDTAINYYLEAGWLYSKEGISSNSKSAFATAQYQLFEKYNFNKKVKQLESKTRKNLSSAKKNETAIRNKKRELRKLKRKIRKEYEAMDMAPPPYLQDQVKKLEREIAALEAGGSADDTDEAAKLETERKKIEK